MPKATWNGAVLAASDIYEIVEGNIYFPAKALKRDYFRTSETHTTCPWKGVASYYDIEVDGKINRNAAWYYPSPSKAARNIKGYVAFQGGIKIEKLPGESEPEPGGFLGTLRRLVGI